MGKLAGMTSGVGNMPLDASKVIQECTALQKDWQVRNDKFPDWYKILLLEDELKQQNMESFVSNDPKTFYNLARHLLTPDVIPHNVKAQGGRAEEAQFTFINLFLERQWDRHNRISRRRGRQAWLRNLVSFVLITGWYSVFAVATDEGTVAEVWNPAEVFPEFGDEDLVRCAHIYTMSPTAARRKLALKGWTFPGGSIPNIDMKVHDYWYTEDTTIRNTVVMGTQTVKPDEDTPFTTIPILVSPVGGLPDRGVIMAGDDSWKEHTGESILAANEGVYKQYNKQMSFLQQILRDSAQFRVMEKSRGGDIIQNVEDIFKRGAVFKMTPEESLEALVGPPVPVDVRTMLFDIQGMMQRGALPYALYGNVQQEIASYLMSQISAAAHQILKDSKDAIQSVLEDVDKLWLTHMRDGNLTVDDFKIPTNIPEDLEVDVGLEIQIAGDLLQRASVAQMLVPGFHISEQTAIKLLFPEIRNPLEEQARANAEAALKQPIAQAVNTIQAYRDEANRLRLGKSPAMADLYEKAAQMLEAKLGTEETPPGQVQPRGGMATPPAGEVVPREYRGAGGA